jgi:hypothetical protein
MSFHREDKKMQNTYLFKILLLVSAFAISSELLAQQPTYRINPGANTAGTPGTSTSVNGTAGTGTTGQTGVGTANTNGTAGVNSNSGTDSCTAGTPNCDCPIGSTTNCTMNSSATGAD